jgi:hypothetical protein
MLIDSKGKLFGKISVVDILIVIIVVGALAGVAYKLKQSKVVTPLAKTNTIQVVLNCESTPDSGVKAIKVGDVVKDKVTTSVLGKVTRIETGPSIVYSTDSDGNIVVSSKPGYSSLKLTIEGTGVIASSGATFGSAEYYVNKSIYEVRVGMSSFNVVIGDIKKL